MSESDLEFVERMKSVLVWTAPGETLIADVKRLLSLARRGAETQWRRIEEAPRDGTEFLAFSQDLSGNGLPSFVSRCGWHEDAGFCTDEIRQPTHFLPLSALGEPE